MAAHLNNLSADKTLREITERIAMAFNPKKIVLFGSRARGDARADSDYDLFVEMESNERPIDRVREVDALFGPRDWSMDVVVYTPDEVKNGIRNAGFILDEIEKDGVIIYAQA